MAAPMVTLSTPTTTNVWTRMSVSTTPAVALATVLTPLEATDADVLMATSLTIA